MDHPTTIATLAGAAVLAALHAFPDIAFVLQCAAVGTFVGTTISYLRQSESDERFRLAYRWSLIGVTLGIAAMIAQWIGVL